jgi:hypothetical protein
MQLKICKNNFTEFIFTSIKTANWSTIGFTVPYSRVEKRDHESMNYNSTCQPIKQILGYKIIFT